MSKSSIGPLACNGTASAEVPEVPADPASGAEERVATRLWAKRGSWEPGAAGGGGGGANGSTGGSASGSTGGGCLGVAAAEAFPLLLGCHGGVGGDGLGEEAAGGVGGGGGAFPSPVGGPAFVRNGPGGVGGGGDLDEIVGGSASESAGGDCLGVAAAEAFPPWRGCHGGTGGDGLGEEGAGGGDGGGGAGIVDGSGAGGADAADPAGGSSRGGCGVTADVAPSAG